MASSEFKRNAAIIGSGSYVPEQIVPNTYFNALLGEDVDTWLRENVQIYERRWCSKDQSTADLIEQACVSALESANIGAEDIDLLINVTELVLACHKYISLAPLLSYAAKLVA